MIQADLVTMICRFNNPLGECAPLMWAHNPSWRDVLLDLCINSKYTTQPLCILSS